MTGPAPRPTNGRRPRWSKDTDKFTLPQERPPVVATRRHWAVLVEPLAKSLPALVVGGWLLLWGAGHIGTANADRDNQVATTTGFLVLVGALVYLGLRIGEWYMRHFIVTNRRVLLTSGIVVRTVALLPLRRITDLTYRETLVGQLLGYGTFRFESAGQQQALAEITYLPHADQLYRKVSDLLFGGGGAASSGDDEGEPEPPSSPPPPTPRGPRAAPDDGRRDTEPIPRARPSRRRVAGRRVRQADR
ncbi:PH domain-containing protein [Geodermatophilus sp. SYSU D00965]